MLRNPFGNIFTDTEQKVLLYLGAVLLLGFSLQILGWTPSLRAESASPDSLLAASATDDTLKVDIRSANSRELMTLSGVGEKRAADIISYRESQGFSSVNQIMLVKGIGAVSYQKMLPYLIRFGDEQPLNKQAGSPRAKAKAKAGTGPQYTGSVNLNTCSETELCSLSGIGEVKAKAIMAYREANGGFKSVDEIMQVKGIGAKTFEKIKARLKV